MGIKETWDLNHNKPVDVENWFINFTETRDVSYWLTDLSMVEVPIRKFEVDEELRVVGEIIGTLRNMRIEDGHLLGDYEFFGDDTDGGVQYGIHKKDTIELVGPGESYMTEEIAEEYRSGYRNGMW